MDADELYGVTPLGEGNVVNMLARRVKSLFEAVDAAVGLLAKGDVEKARLLLGVAKTFDESARRRRPKNCLTSTLGGDGVVLAVDSEGDLRHIDWPAIERMNERFEYGETSGLTLNARVLVAVREHVLRAVASTPPIRNDGSRPTAGGAS